MLGPDWLIQESRNASRDPLGGLFPVQLTAAQAILKPGARVVLNCGRRSGKTEAAVHAAARVLGRKRGAKVAFLALTRSSAERYAWPKIVELDRRLNLGLAFNQSKLQVTAPNGSQLWIIGANKADEIEKLRGQDFDLVIVDETASFRPALLATLISDVIGPTLVDHRGGLVLLGTPGAVLSGYFYEACTGIRSGWEVFRWTLRDNPHIRDVDAALAQVRTENDWTEDSPTYRREYLGEWVNDPDALVYRLRDQNLIDVMPAGYAPDSPEWLHVVGIDYGYVDSTAWTVWAFQRHTSGDVRAYVPWSGRWNDGIPSRYTAGLDIDATQGLLPSDSGPVTKRIVEHFRPVSCWGDSGGLGKGYIAEANRRFGLTVRAAKKLDKLGNIELLNDGLRSGRVQIVRDQNAALIDEMRTVQWALKTKEVNVNGLVRHEQRKDIDDRFENHATDSARYAYPEVRSYSNQKPEPVPTPADGDAWLDRQIEATQRRQRQRRKAGWI